MTLFLQKSFHLFFCLSLLLSPFFVKAQSEETFIITQKNNITNIKDYETALRKADLKCYRMLDQRRVLKFDSGVIVELLSVNELLQKGIVVRKDCLTDPSNPNKDSRVFTLLPNGIIAESTSPAPPTKQIKSKK